MSVTTRIHVLTNLTVGEVAAMLDGYPNQKCLIPTLKMGMCLSRDVKNILKFMHDVDVTNMDDDEMCDLVDLGDDG